MHFVLAQSFGFYAFFGACDGLLEAFFVSDRFYHLEPGTVTAFFPTIQTDSI